MLLPNLANVGNTPARCGPNIESLCNAGAGSRRGPRRLRAMSAEVEALSRTAERYFGEDRKSVRESCAGERKIRERVTLHWGGCK